MLQEGLSTIRRIVLTEAMVCHSSMGARVKRTQNTFPPRSSGSLVPKTTDSLPRGVTRLEDVRGKKQVWRPYDRTWGSLEADVLH